MRNAVRSTRLVIFLVLVFSLLPATALADSTATIDFEGLTEGQIVSSLSSGSGISGDVITGSVVVLGVNPTFGAATNAAMIFDATCTGGCSGDDPDLEFPAQGNILIVSEDLDGSDPDDAVGSTLALDFRGFGPGTVTVESLWIGDTEEGGIIRFYDASLVEIGSFPIPQLNDHEEATLNINFPDVAVLGVFLTGSGAIDDLKISVPGDEPPPPGGTEGCTPGYWKQSRHFDSWTATGYVTSQTVESVFDVPDSLGLDDMTLVQALNSGGGGGNTVEGAAKKLLQTAVAALLNASHQDVDYTRSTADIIADVNTALASSDRHVMRALASELDTDNQLGCPLN